MIETSPLIQWIVAVQLLAGPNQSPRMVHLEATEQMCREMARDLLPGQVIVATLDGGERTVVFRSCWRAENGRLREEIK